MNNTHSNPEHKVSIMYEHLLRLSFLTAVILSNVFAMTARTVSGTVLSSTDSTAVAGATCRLFADGKLITGTSTDDKGAFLLKTEVKEALKLDVSMSGFTSTNVVIESGAKNLNVGTIYIDQGTTLKELTVTGDYMINSKGRTVVFPSESEVRSSSNSISLFQKLPLPGLLADPINRSISVDGGSPVILINGIPSSIDDVRSLQPKDIEKVEFSRMTPARYADSGSSGFINITLKKRTDGGNVYLWGRSAVTTAFVDANLSASYHQGPSQFVLQYNPSWRNYQRVYDNMTESYIGDDFTVNLKEHDRNPFFYHSHFMQLRYNYSPSMKTLFSATFSATPFYDGRRRAMHTEDSQLGDYVNNNKSSSKDFSPSLDLFLRQDFNDKNSLEVQVVGTLIYNDYRRRNDYTYSDGSEESFIMDADSRRQSLISEVSYIHNFSDKTELSAGYQNTVSRSTNKYLNTGYKPILTENNNYAYVSLGQSAGKFYFSLSTGVKMFWVENDMNKRHFIRNLSSAQVSWNINPKWNIRASFNYSPSIPSLTSLTDYPQQVSPYLVSNGNPNLKVADNFAYRLYGSYRIKKFMVALFMNFLDIKNSVVRDVTYLGDKKFLSQTVNARYRKIFANCLSLRVSDVYGFGANASFFLEDYWTAGADWTHHLQSFSASLSVWWNKGPFTISYWRRIPGKTLNGHNVSKQENGDTLQFEWKPNKHWTLGASWMFMFDSKGTRYPSWNYSPVNPSQSDRYIKDNANMVVLSVTYNTDFGAIFRSARRNLNNSDKGSSLLQM